jgi:hypothetical protein
MATSPERLHDEDFYAWTKDQAEALRHLAETRPYVGIDFAHLIEEVEELGDNRLLVVRSQLRQQGEAAAALPAACSYVLDHLLDEEWYPTNRHDIVDD